LKKQICGPWLSIYAAPSTPIPRQETADRQNGIANYVTLNYCYIKMEARHKMRIYLDNCCYNRPFDNQDSFTIRFETDAKLKIQELIKNKTLELIWSFILDFENNDNPYIDVKNNIAQWKKLAVVVCLRRVHTPAACGGTEGYVP
jgi:hypothetical protein